MHKVNWPTILSIALAIAGTFVQLAASYPHKTDNNPDRINFNSDQLNELQDRAAAKPEVKMPVLPMPEDIRAKKVARLRESTRRLGSK